MSYVISDVISVLIRLLELKLDRLDESVITEIMSYVISDVITFSNSSLIGLTNVSVTRSAASSPNFIACHNNKSYDVYYNN